MAIKLSAAELRFSERVAQARQFRKLNQQQLASQIGLSRVAVGLIETGRRRVSLREAIDIADVVGVPLLDLYDDQPLTITQAD